MTAANPTPTESAEAYFKKAYDLALWGANHTRTVQDPTGIAVYDIAASLTAISKGLGEMAIGLRATYLVLGRVEQKLDRAARR
jgi:hypothetical protein